MVTKKRIPLTLALLIAFLPFTTQAQEDTEWSEFETSIPVEQPADEGAYVDDKTYIDDLPIKARKRKPLRRSIMREDVTIRIKTLRLDSGKKVQLVYGAPKKSKVCPAVFVLDVETNVFANNRGVGFANSSKKRVQEINQAGYLLKSPFGSNMLGNGFAVAYVIAEDLETLRTARTADWIGMFNRVRDHKQVDSNSVFLFSTREWANTAIYLTSKYNFSGFILEEPSYMLFTRNTYDNIIENSDRLTSDEIWQRTDPTRADRYYDVLSRITTPIMLIRNKNSDAYSFNEKTLIPKLVEANAFFETVDVSGPARSLTLFGGRTGIIELEPEVAYYPNHTHQWLDKMITYMKMNSTTEAVALRDPANYKSW